MKSAESITEWPVAPKWTERAELGEGFPIARASKNIVVILVRVADWCSSTSRAVMMEFRSRRGKGYNNEDEMVKVVTPRRSQRNASIATSTRRKGAHGLAKPRGTRFLCTRLKRDSKNDGIFLFLL